MLIDWHRLAFNLSLCVALVGVTTLVCWIIVKVQDAWERMFGGWRRRQDLEELEELWLLAKLIKLLFDHDKRKK